MKRNFLSILAFFIGGLFLEACTPEDLTYYDNSYVDLDSIGKIELLLNQRMVLANGTAQIDLRPRLYTTNGYLIPDERVKEEFLEYHSDEVAQITRHFSTSDQSLIGKTINVYYTLKGRDLVSDTCSFQVADPMTDKYTDEIVIPVVFHIIQTTEDVEEVVGMYEQARIQNFLGKMNNVFAGKISNNPVGVNTRIRFQFAEYAPNGKKMLEPGINRFVVNEINHEDYPAFLKENKLVWPGDKYLNIWLVSNKVNDTKYKSYFGYYFTAKNCLPQYVNDGVDKTEFPKGLNLKPIPEEGMPILSNGILYRLQDFDLFQYACGQKYTNDLMYYIGWYFGLKNTAAYNGNTRMWNDYCEDTMDYGSTGSFPNVDINDRLYKMIPGFYFKSENIMDDAAGLHTSISRDQTIRLRWVLENCPDRAAWKSNFAFVGQ